MNKQIAFNICRRNTAEVICANMSYSQLQEMYVVLYDMGPHKRLKSCDLARACKNYVGGIDRALSMKP